MDMKFAIKIIAASLALASAGQASATIGDQNVLGTAGGPEMFLAVWDSVAQKSYVRDLGIHLNDFLPAANLGTVSGVASKLDKTTLGGVVSSTAAPVAGTVAFGATPSVALGSVLTSGYTLNFAADPLLASFLGSAGSLPTSLQWMVGSMDATLSSGNNQIRALTTSNTDVASSGVNNLSLTGFAAVDGTFVAANNAIVSNNVAGTVVGNMGATNGSAAVTKLDGGQAYFDSSTGGYMGNWGGKTTFSNLAAVGTSQKFWYLGSNTAGGSAAVTVQAFTNASWKLDTTGNLAYTVAAVPEADTWAMLLAGLGLMGFIARRRLQG